jgi:DNA-binding NarL/FixJ family response regulator
VFALQAGLGDHLLVRVLVVDRSELLREAVREVLEDDYGMQVSTSSADIDEAVAEAGRSSVDVAVLGVDMGGARGLRFIREFRRRVPEVAVVAFGGFEFAPSEDDLAGLNVNVHLPKGVSNAEIVLAVRAAAGDAAATRSQVTDAASRSLPERGLQTP